MSCADLILGLPAELSGEIVGRWLRVEEIVRLDSAFCQTEARECLHRSVLTSASCIITSVSSLIVQALNWVALRRIRAEHVDVRGKNDLISEQYLQVFGRHIKSVCLTDTYCDIGTSIILIARYCVNLQSVDYSAYETTDNFVRLLNACPGIDSLKVSICLDDQGHLHVEPKLNTLRVRSLDIDGGKVATEQILSMCVPEAVQRLKIWRNECISDWSRFCNLRSLDVSSYASTRHSLVQILDQCRSIVNLCVSPNSSFDRALGEHTPPLRSLNIENGCMDNESQLLCPHFVQKQKHTLEALYACACDGLSDDAINLVLAECPNLRTLSIDGNCLVDFTLMGSLTTLIVDCFEGDGDWSMIQKNCHSLQYLHVIFRYVQVQDPTVMVEALSGMPTLRALYFAGVTEDCEPARTEAANQLRVLRPTLYIEENNEDEGAWYDLFALPI